MDDYDTRYRELRAAGFQGWAGSDFERGLARLTETLDRLEHEGFLRKPSHVLELGCGNGLSSFLLAQKGYEVQGIDISRTAILWAEERFAAAGLVGSFQEGDVRDMPIFGDGSFDIVIDGSCLAQSSAGRPLIVSSMCGPPKSDDAKASLEPRLNDLLKDGQP